MQQRGFNQGVEVILGRERRYARRAYYFLREALDFTLARAGSEEGEGARHVRGQQLAEGFRDHALEQFGPMAAAVLEQWGVQRSEDVGEMVYLLIDIGVFGRSDDDRREDFAARWNLESAFVDPFLPPSARARPRDGAEVAGVTE